MWVRVPLAAPNLREVKLHPTIELIGISIGLWILCIVLNITCNVFIQITSDKVFGKDKIDMEGYWALTVVLGPIATPFLVTFALLNLSVLIVNLFEGLFSYIFKAYKQFIHLCVYVILPGYRIAKKYMLIYYCMTFHTLKSLFKGQRPDYVPGPQTVKQIADGIDDKWSRNE